MTRKVIGFVSLLTVLLTVSSFSQISSLQVNGSSTTFTMTSGDSVWWSYHVSPVGATAQVQIWYDVNANGTIEPGTDLLWQAFSQTDGDTSGGNGPPDYDRTANGVTTLNKIPIGLAPGKYVMLFSQGAANLTVTGTVNALASPAHTLSGTVTVPVGKSAANIFVGVESSAKKDNGPGWWALTNGSGNYQIAMGADTSGGPWRVHLGVNPYPPGIVTPPYQFLYIVGNPSGLNISIVAAAAQIVGTVKDDLGAVIPGADVAASNMYVGQANSVQANASGFYQIGLTSAMLSGNTGFAVTAYFQQNQGMTTNRLDAMGVTGTISNGDSV
ncbi:MAG TPA: carboxypeptidase-like regulatory domain-containing protein, partial [Bacteroidota bacterium]